MGGFTSERDTAEESVHVYFERFLPKLPSASNAVDERNAELKKYNAKLESEHVEGMNL